MVGVITTCKWCGSALGILPSGILLCPRCDNTPNSEIPNHRLIRDTKPKP